MFQIVLRLIKTNKIVTIMFSKTQYTMQNCWENCYLQSMHTCL